MLSSLRKYDWNKIADRIVEVDELLVVTKNDARKVGEWRKELSFFYELLEIKKILEDLFISKEKIMQEISMCVDIDMLSLFEEEREVYEKKMLHYEAVLVELSYEEDKKDTRSAFLEIRAGTGGQEASLFVSDLARMYQLYAVKQGWVVSVTDYTSTEVGGFREIVLFIEGKNVFKYFNFESGVHRVQRVPSTENAGRVHTSTVTVAILPEVESIEVAIDEKDLRVDTYRAGGAGGQHVNKTDSAVRITHIPSGIVVQCQDERSQHKNKAKALKALQSKLFTLQEEKQKNEISEQRRSMVASADRSEKIRTYNYPQNRITDHRGGITLNQLDFIMNGNMDTLLNGLIEKVSEDKIVNKFLIGYLS